MEVLRQAWKRFADYIIRSFTVPSALNWGYPVLFAGLGAVIALLIRLGVMSTNVDYSQTSIIGYVLFISIFVILAFIIPTVILSGRFARYDSQLPSAHIVGDYTGIGVLILSFLSGVP